MKRIHNLVIAKMILEDIKNLSDGEIDRIFNNVVQVNTCKKAAKEIRDLINNSQQEQDFVSSLRQLYSK
jgi:dsRNA-specific ribonuclease